MKGLAFGVLVLCTVALALCSHASQRMVLGELFTNWACSPCAPANAELDRFAPLHPNLAVIRYHVWWPGSTDPFYLANVSENTARTNYYGVNAVPWFFVDGYIDGSSNYPSWEGLVSNRESAESPLEITMDGTYQSSTRSGTVYAYIAATDVISATSLRLHFVITESEVHLNAPNGQTVFQEAMRDMLPNSSGEIINISSPGDTLIRSRDFTLGPSWALENCEIIVFVQSNTTKEVLQAAKWKIPIDIPSISYVSNLVIDSLGNKDGRADPGESVDMVVMLENDPIFHDATNVSGELTCTDPDVNITQEDVSFPDMPAGSSVDNSLNPFKFSVDGAALPHRAYFDLHVTADPGSYSADFRFWIMLGRPDVLLVDDDEGSVYEMFYEPVLDSLQVAYDKWDVKNDLGGPGLALYHCIIWFTGDDSLTTLSAQDETDLSSFLDDGGSLIITGQNIGQDVAADSFYTNYLHAGLVKSATGDHIINGEPGDPIGDGLSLITAGSGGAGNQTSQDVVAPVNGAYVVFRYSPDSVAAIRYASAIYQVVYYAFGLEGLNRTGSYAGRRTVLARSLELVGCPPPVGVEEVRNGLRTAGRSVSLDCYPNPSRGSVEVSAVVSGGAGRISLSVYDLAGRLVDRLMDTDYPGNCTPISAEWTGRDSKGKEVHDGVYFVKLVLGDISKTEKVVMLK